MCRNRIMLTGLLITLIVVTARKSRITVETNTASRIFFDHLTSMVAASFDASKCCNVLMSGESVATRSVFKEFVRTYQYEYTLNNSIYHCDSYFIISASVDDLISAMNNVPTRISTCKLLIVVVNNVEETAQYFNVSAYENANVNIVAYNGLWTLSENFLRPRAFKKLSSPNEMELRQSNSIINLRGQEVRAMAYWNPPFCYLKSTVKRTVKGITEEYFIKTNKWELDGIEVKLFMLIAEKLNFSWTIRNPRNDDRYGHKEGNKWVGGMLGQVIENKADFAFSSMWMSLEKYELSNLTQPWARIHIHFLVPRPKPHDSFWALTKTLSPKVWSAIAVMMIFQSIYVYVRAQAVPEMPERFRSFIVTWTELLARLVGSWAPTEMRGFELQFQLWHFIGILLVTAFSSSLSARLTTPVYQKNIDTLQDFVGANLTWSTDGEPPAFSMLFDDSDPYAKQVIKRYVPGMTDDDKYRGIARRKYAVLGNTIGNNFFPKRTRDIRGFTGLRLMRKVLANVQMTFVVQSWLLQSVDSVMLRLQEVGLVRYHLKDVLHRRTGRILREVTVEYNDEVTGPRVLKLKPLGAVFIMFAIGLFISTIAFFFELTSVSWRRPTRNNI